MSSVFNEATKRLQIGIDVDGVLADFTTAARQLCKKLFNGRPADDVVWSDWSFESLGISSDEESHFWRTVDTIPNWWMFLDPLEHTGQLENLANLHRVYFITNRKDGTGDPVEEQTAKWLVDIYGIDHPTVICTGQKGPISRALHLDYFIDDRPKNYNDVCLAAPNCKSALLSAPYNTNHPAKWTVSNFNEFAKFILWEDSWR